MREKLWGYAAAVLEEGNRDELRRTAADLRGFAVAVRDHEELRQALCDAGLPVAVRRAIVEDILRGRAGDATMGLLAYAVNVEPVGELAAAFDALVEAAAEEAARADSSHDANSAPREEPMGGRAAIRERADGYATRVFEDMTGELAEVEDELFRFARLIERTEELRRFLTDPELPAGLRRGVVAELLSGRARPATVRLATFATWAGRPRDLLALLDWMVERAASERNLRVAEVRSATPLDDEQRRMLSSALGRVADRAVELRELVDPALIGGVVALVGDTMVDGSIKTRIDRLRTDLGQSTRPGQGETWQS